MLAGLFLAFCHFINAGIGQRIVRACQCGQPTLVDPHAVDVALGVGRLLRQCLCHALY